MFAKLCMRCETMCKITLSNYLVPVAGMKLYLPPPKYDVDIPEKPKLRVLEKVPTYPANLRPPKMFKSLKLMRGPELIHNKLMHEQYGILALGGGRLRWGHFEMMRMSIGRSIDTSRMFAIWRVDSPWQPITKKGQGQRMGGGKGAIDHYVTPIKSGRIILEVAGKCEFREVKGFLKRIADKLPFKAIPVSHQLMQEMEQKEKQLEENNVNPYTIKYVIDNNLGNCHHWISYRDKLWYFKYL